MKKIFYLLSCVAVALSFAGCNPMDNTYKELGDLPKPALTVNLTLAAADYNLLPTTDYAKTAQYYKTLDDAKASIPTILSKKYTNYNEGSAVTVTYATQPVAVKPVDSLYANVAYTFQPSDYALINPAFTNLSAAQMITALGLKYPGAVENTLAVITFNFFDQGASSIQTHSYLYMNGAWVRIYHITAAQYTAMGKGGNNNNFVAADAPLIPTYINTLLKADPSVSVTAKAGDVRYVSYRYFAGGSAPNNFQRVVVLTYNGTDWTTKPAAATPLIFAKTNGVWVPDNTVRYTLVKADYNFIAAIPNIGSAAAMANLASFGNFNIQGGTTTWTDAQIVSGISQLLKNKYVTGLPNQKFVITYAAYNGANITPVKTYVYNGTAFVIAP